MREGKPQTSLVYVDTHVPRPGDGNLDLQKLYAEWGKRLDDYTQWTPRLLHPAILREPQVTEGALRTLLVLVYLADEKGEVKVHPPTLAEKTGRRVRVLQVHYRRLERAGYLKAERDPRTHFTHVQLDMKRLSGEPQFETRQADRPGI